MKGLIRKREEAELLIKGLKECEHISYICDLDEKLGLEIRIGFTGGRYYYESRMYEGVKLERKSTRRLKDLCEASEMLWKDRKYFNAYRKSEALKIQKWVEA